MFFEILGQSEMGKQTLFFKTNVIPNSNIDLQMLKGKVLINSLNFVGQLWFHNVRVYLHPRGVLISVKLR